MKMFSCRKKKILVAREKKSCKTIDLSQLCQEIIFLALGIISVAVVNP